MGKLDNMFSSLSTKSETVLSYVDSQREDFSRDSREVSIQAGQIVALVDRKHGSFEMLTAETM